MKNTGSDQQYIRAELFRDLHARPGIFVAPNPWDAGSAKMLAALGFEALATTSAGLAFMLGKPDGEGVVTREEAIANAGAIAAAVNIPVSGDLENGYGDDPQACAATVLMAAKAGLVGCSIEDNSGRPNDPIYEFELALERIQSAVSAARSLSFPFTLTARAENLIYGRIDMKDTLRRLEAFADAGADVLFAPGLSSREDIIAAVQTVSPKPLNVVMGLKGPNFSVDELAEMGVKRISIGSSLARAAYDAFYNAAKEIYTKGSFGYAGNIMSYDAINAIFR
jgi:2-methylisocitrate lyase-like PEP mutase family enzyme